MRYTSAYFVLAVACIVIGFLLASQFKVIENTEFEQNYYDLQRPRTIKNKIEAARDRREILQEQVEELRDQLDQAAAGPRLAELKKEVDKVRSYAGLTELQGPGVKVILKDNQKDIKPGENPNLYVLHDEDVLSVLNELKAAGAEALSMNDHRIIATTEVRCIGPTVLINKDVRLSPPFEIKAIGNTDTLYNSLNMTGGVVDRLKFWGIEVTVEKASQLNISPYEGRISFDYASPQ